MSDEKKKNTKKSVDEVLGNKALFSKIQDNVGKSKNLNILSQTAKSSADSIARDQDKAYQDQLHDLSEFTRSDSNRQADPNYDMTESEKRGSRIDVNNLFKPWDEQAIENANYERLIVDWFAENVSNIVIWRLLSPSQQRSHMLTLEREIINSHIETDSENPDAFTMNPDEGDSGGEEEEGTEEKKTEINDITPSGYRTIESDARRMHTIDHHLETLHQHGMTNINSWSGFVGSPMRSTSSDEQKS